LADHIVSTPNLWWAPMRGHDSNILFLCSLGGQ
jgi:hypothetical protein